MSTANVQQFPTALVTRPCRNLSTTVTIGIGSAIIVDASNIMDNAGVKNDLAVTLPTDTTNPSVCLGVTNVNIPPGEEGSYVPANSGQYVLMKCDGAVTAGTVVDNSVTSNKTHWCKTHASAKYSLGLALQTGADADWILVQMSHAAPNA